MGLRKRSYSSVQLFICYSAASKPQENGCLCIRHRGFVPKHFLSVSICYGTECTKIAHHRSLAIFTADEGIAGNSAARIIFTRFHRRKKSRFASDLLRRGYRASWGLKKSRVTFPGAVKIAAATAENRAILVHSEPLE